MAQFYMVKAESDTTKTGLIFSGYIETYFCYDISKSNSSTRPNFVYSHNRLNEVNLNLGYIKAAYQKDGVRSNLALMSGTYANKNLANEPSVFRNIFEANAGVKLSKKYNLWIDAGVFGSHIGFESAIGKDCWNLTRSIMAENSPYYESGVKLSYTSKNEKWLLSGLVLNGWQRIHKEEGNTSMAGGHQVTYKPNDNITINSSSFAGRVNPDSVRVYRYFHNLYGQFQLNKRIGLTLGFDYGIQQRKKNDNTFFRWYSPIAILKCQLNKKFFLSLRGEYYSDKHQVIISTRTANGFQTYSYSINLDYCIKKNVIWRIETRAFNSKDKVFIMNKKPSTKDYFITTALAISF
jgi:hypothetical protein